MIQFNNPKKYCSALCKLQMTMESDLVVCSSLVRDCLKATGNPSLYNQACAEAKMYLGLPALTHTPSILGCRGCQATSQVRSATKVGIL